MIADNIDTMDSRPTERIFALDALRGLAIVLILILHSWSMLGLDVQDTLMNHCYRALVNLGVPLFFMISGALLLSANPLQSSIADFLKKRLKRVLIPFLVWSIVIYAISVVTSKYGDIHTFGSAVLNFVPYLVENKINPSHWFVHVVILLYLITPILQRAFQLSDRRTVGYCLLLWLIYLIFTQTYSEVYMLQVVYSRFVNYIGLFISGYYIVKYMSDNHRRNCILGFVGFAFFYILNVFLAWKGHSLAICNYLEVLCLFLGFYSLPKPKSETTKFVGFVTLLSKYSYTIYLMHIPLIGVLCTVSLFHNGPMALMPIVMAFIVLIVCFAFCYCIDKCRFIKTKWLGI